MKKIILLLLVPVCSWAQFAAGNKFIGGNFSFNNQNNSNSNYYRPGLVQSFSVSPSVGFFVNQNMALGLRLGYSSLSSDLNGTNNQSTSISGGLFLRRYFL